VQSKHPGQRLPAHSAGHRPILQSRGAAPRRKNITAALSLADASSGSRDVLHNACFEFPLAGHDTLGAVLHAVRLEAAMIFELCANGALAGTTDVVLPHMSLLEHARTSNGMQVPLFDLFPPTRIDRCSNNAWVHFRNAPPLGGCAPGATAFNTTTVAGVAVTCQQTSRLGLLRCGPAAAPLKLDEWGAPLPADKLKWAFWNASLAAAHRALYAQLDHATTTRQRCGYWFVRRPVFIENGEVTQVLSHRGNHANWTAVPLRLVANALGKIVKAHALECLEVNYMERGYSATRAPDLKLEARVLETIGIVLGNATTVTRRKRIYGTTANVQELLVAAASHVLITEIGTLWSDELLTSRCAVASMLPSVVLEISQDEARGDPTALSPRCDGSPFLRALEVNNREYTG